LNNSVLMDLKCIGLNPSRYVDTQPATDTKPRYAANSRASRVGNEYLRKAREVDTNFNGTAQGAVGPMETMMTAYGGVKPLVAGFFGELNDGFEAMLGQVAEVGVRQLQDALYTKTPEQARAVLLWQLRRKMAAAILRANLNCLQSLMTNISPNGVGVGSEAHRFNARKYFFPRGDAASCSYAYRSTHANFPRDMGGAFY